MHLTRAPLKGVTQIGIVFILYRFIYTLVLDIIPNLGLIQADCVDIITPSPKTMPFKIPLKPTVFLKYNHCTFPLEVTYYG